MRGRSKTLQAMLAIAALSSTPCLAANLPATWANCSDHRNAALTITAATPVPLSSCGLLVPPGARVLLLGSATSAMTAGDSAAYEALYTLAIDGTTVTQARRRIDSRNDTGDGADKPVAVAILATPTPGFHRFTLQVQRFGAGGSVRVYDPGVQAIVVPPALATTHACGAAPGENYLGTDGNIDTVLECSVNLPAAGTALVIGTGTVQISINEPAHYYEGRFTLSIDNANAGNSAADRRVDAYDDCCDGIEETMAATLARPVAAGPHTFRLMAQRAAGQGNVFIVGPALAVVVIPDASAVCLDDGDDILDTSGTATLVMRTCTATASTTGSALLLGSAWHSLAGTTASHEHEALWTLRADGTTVTGTDRYVNLYLDPDGGDGDDRTPMTAAIVDVTPGPHVFDLAARRFTGTGNVRAFDPQLAAVLLPRSANVLFADGFE